MYLQFSFQYHILHLLGILDDSGAQIRLLGTQISNLRKWEKYYRTHLVGQTVKIWMPDNKLPDPLVGSEALLYAHGESLDLILIS